MRKNIIVILAFLIGSFAFSSCETDLEKITIKEAPGVSELGAIPTLDATAFNLEKINDIITLTWTAADFGFQASTTYTLEVDAANGDFSAPISILSTQALTATISVGDFNKKLLGAGYDNFDVSVSMKARIVASVASNVTAIASTPVAFTVVPFATSFPPIYMCGAATGGWDWTKGVEVRSTAPNVYSCIAYFIQNETFRFFAQAAWGTSYNYPWFPTGSVSTMFENANDNDLNFKFLQPTGYYKVTVNLKLKTVSMEAVAEPKMFMTGAALGGWNWTTDYVQMTWKSDGKYEAITEFAVETFRFFAQADWGPDSYNYPYFADGTVSALFENANDGDKNFKFIGTPGMYKIKLNMLDKIVEMEAVPTK